MTDHGIYKEKKKINKKKKKRKKKRGTKKAQGKTVSMFGGRVKIFTKQEIEEYTKNLGQNACQNSA